MDKERQRFIIIASLSVAVLIIIMIVSAVVIHQSRNFSTAYTPSSTDTATKESVDITNSGDYQSKIPSLDFSSLESSLFTTVKQNVSTPAASYAATIRDTSYKTSTTSDGFPQRNFVVDIPAIKQSYHITVEGDSSTDYQTVYILCPTASELIYPAFTCKDQTS